MSKSVFTNFNILFREPSAVSGSFLYESTETDWMEQKQRPSGKDKRQSIFFVCKIVLEGVFLFRLIVKNKPWHFKELEDKKGFLINASPAS